MRIAVVLHDVLWPLSGGGSMRVYWVIKRLVERSHDVIVLAPFGQKKPMPSVLSNIDPKLLSRMIQDKIIESIDDFQRMFNEIRIIHLGDFSRFMSNKEKAYSVLSMKIAKQLLNIDIDKIYAINIVSALPSYIISKIKHVPVIYDIIDLTTGLSSNKYISTIGPKIEFFIARHSDKVITMSYAFMDMLEKQGVKDISVVPHGVDTEIFSMQKYQHIKKRNLAVYTGGIEKHDDILLIPKAANIILKEINMDFLIIGSGKWLEKLRNEVKESGMSDNFTFIDWIDNAKLPEYLAEAKLGIITHMDCPAGKVALVLKGFEFMSMGIPVIMPRLPGMIEEVGDNEERGKIYDCGDYHGLADAVLMLLKDEQLLHQKSVNCITFVSQHRQWKDMADKIVNICELAER